MTDNAEKPQPKTIFKNKFLTFSIGVIGSLLLIFCIFVAMAFSTEQTLPKTASKMSSSTFTKVALYSKLAAVQGDLFGSNKAKQFTVKLSEAEVNLFLNLLIQMQRSFVPEALDIDALKSFSDKKATLFIEYDQLVIGFSGKSSISTPFGNYLNIKAIISPEIMNGKENIKITKVKVGSLSLFGKNFVNSAIAQELAKPKNAQYVKLIKELSIKDDILTISINRKEFFALVPIEDYLKFIYKLLRQ